MTHPIFSNNFLVYRVKKVEFLLCAEEIYRNLKVSVYTELETKAMFFRFSTRFGLHSPYASRYKFQKNCKSFSIKLCTIYDGSFLTNHPVQLLLEFSDSLDLDQSPDMRLKVER